MNLQVTNIENLKKMAQGEVIELPPFIDGEKFCVRVKKPSLLTMVTNNEIPNSLLAAAEELFFGKQSSKGIDMKQMTEVMLIIAKTSLIEPSIDDLTEIGLSLTDEQIVDLFNYTQEGVQALQSFRKKQKDIKPNNDKSGIQNKAKQNIKHRK